MGTAVFDYKRHSEFPAQIDLWIKIAEAGCVSSGMPSC